MSGIIGTVLKFIKGEILAGTGANEETIPLGTEFYVDMDTVHFGFVRFEGGMPTDAVGVRVGDNQPIPKRRELGETNKEDWPLGPDGVRKDPWAPDSRAVMIGLDPMDSGAEYTFVTASWGGRGAFEKLCREYAAEYADHPGQMPIISIGSYNRPHKTFGKIPTPTFEIVRWATLSEALNGDAEPETRGRKKIATKKAAAKKTPAKKTRIIGVRDDEEDDEAPWDEED